MPRKGSKPQKGPNRARIKFSCFLAGDTQKSWSQTKFEVKPVKISPFRTAQTHIFGRKLEIRTMPVRRYHQGSRACQVSNPTDIRSQSYGHTIMCTNNEKSDQFYRKVAFLMYSERVNFRPQSWKEASKLKPHR